MSCGKAHTPASSREEGQGGEILKVKQRNKFSWDLAGDVRKHKKYLFIDEGVNMCGCRCGEGLGFEFDSSEKLCVFLAGRMAETSPEYIMCVPPLGLGY